MSRPSEYTAEFFELHRDGGRRSARTIVPMLMGLVRPQSVVDVGCGTGTWLASFMEHGVADVLGVDGEYVPRETLDIPATKFLAHDLREPLRIDREFDLVVALEVAEHLPAICAAGFVESLVRLGPVIVFSAAIPSQGGTGHLNEQWPEYWVTEFERHGYVVVDALRQRVWSDDGVDVWYAQNILLLVRRDDLARYPALATGFKQTRRSQLALVHPKLFAEVSTKYLAAAESCTAYAAEVEQLKAESAAHRATAEAYIAEAAAHKEAVARHQATAEHHVAESARVRAEAEADRARYVAEAATLRGEAEADRARYVAERAEWRREWVWHSALAARYVAELAKARDEAAVYRGRWHSAKTECDRRGTELAWHRDELALCRLEVESQRATAAFFMGEIETYKSKANPANLSLRRLLRALPRAAWRALRRRSARGVARVRSASR